MVAGFRIRTVAIEGFKGFTTRKEIEFKQRHVFLLGKNGAGKSSIVEAIRWGLFGSTRRRNEIVANRSHGGRCRVEIALTGDGKQWNLRRTLNPGSTGGSDAVLTDEHGKERLLGEIMPKLGSVDAGEGAHIIFASQEPLPRSQSGKLDSFGRTIFAHLGLTYPQSLLEQMENFLVELELTETRLGEEITNSRQEIDSQIQQFERQRGIILRSPPWDSGHAPSVAETEVRARDLIGEITSKPIDESLLGVSLDALIDNAEETLTDKRAQDQGALQKELTEIVERRRKLEEFRNIHKEIEMQRSKIQDLQSQLSTTLSGDSLEHLQHSVEEELAAKGAMELRRQAVQGTIRLLDRDEGDSADCPVCNASHQRHLLKSQLQDTLRQLPDDTTGTSPELEARLKKVHAINQESQNLSRKLSELEESGRTTRAQIDAEDAKQITDHVSTDNLNAIISRCLEQERSIEARIENRTDWIDAKEKRLFKLKEEQRFHVLQKDLARLLQSRNQFGRVDRAYQDLVAFGESVREIRQVIKTCFNEQLKKDIPGVSENLSRVFAALTNHTWYDRLTIAIDRLPELILQVASSHDPAVIGHPTGVLNGQAQSALALVPYFAFSQTDDTPTEVYLVLLDDPTQAFDEEHIGMLVERLAELGRRVQLIVASQESTRFRKLLPRKFDLGSYVVVEPTSWSYHDGPRLKIEYN